MCNNAFLTALITAVSVLLGITPLLPAAPVTISGTIQYTGATGNEGNDTNNNTALFPARGAKVDLFDDNIILFGDVLLGTMFTNNNGAYSFTVDDADTAGGLALTIDPFIKVFPESRPVLPAPGGVKSNHKVFIAGALSGGDDTVGAEYVYSSTPLVAIPTGQNQTINHSFPGASNLDRSFSAFDSMQEASRYYSTLPGSVNNSVRTLFPTNESTSNFSEGRMHILQGDRHDWDVNMHEYGHYVQSLTAGISQSPGGNHSSLNNLRFQRADLNRQQADRLAWGEGWATYFGISGQQQMNSASLGLQRVGDTIYHDNNDGNGTGLGLRYGIENQTVGGRPSRGEDNEASVARILFDVYDANNEAGERDRLGLGDTAVWNLIRNNTTSSLDQFWDALISQPNTTNTQRINYGAIFQAHSVSPQPDVTSVNGDVFPVLDIVSPQFRWAIPMGGTGGVYNNPLLNNFGVKFFGSDDTEILDSGLLGNVTNYTPAPLTWAFITTQADTVRWIVYGRNTTNETLNVGAPFSYTTGDYWSDALNFLVVPEPATNLLLALGFISTARKQAGSLNHMASGQLAKECSHV